MVTHTRQLATHSLEARVRQPNTAPNNFRYSNRTTNAMMLKPTSTKQSLHHAANSSSIHLVTRINGRDDVLGEYEEPFRGGTSQKRVHQPIVQDFDVLVELETAVEPTA